MSFHQLRPNGGRLSLLGILAIGVVTLCAVGASATVYDTIVPTSTYAPLQQCSEGTVGDAAPCQTDNNQLTYYMSSVDYALESADRTMVKSTVMEGMYEPTDLNVVQETDPVFSGSSETDIIWQEGAVPGDDTGYTWCNDVASGWKCDQQYVRIESASYSNSGLVCHEAGHAVGLVHGPSAWQATTLGDSSMFCMRKPTPNGTPLGAINRSSINDVY